MRRIVPSNFQMSLGRSGGSIIRARVDAWKATPTGWSHAAEITFNHAVNPSERVSQQLAEGEYTCVFQCTVEESLNGAYSFDLAVGGVSTFADHGNVNTTSASNDSRIFKDQFLLEVRSGGQS